LIEEEEEERGKLLSRKVWSRGGKVDNKRR
jgi:hypothetical protein